jgi:hypothetical protein
MVSVGLVASALVLCAPARAQAPTLTWPEAVARLAAERTRALACLEQARVLGITAANPLAITYAEAKAEVDAVVAGLSTALAEGRGQPEDLPGLERRMTAGFEGRRRFCEQVLARQPPRPTGEKGVLGDVLGAVVRPVVEAVVELWKHRDDTDRLRRETVRTQLEATRWPDYAASLPSR